MLFVNDPLIADLPKPGETPALVAPRTQAGEAVRWSPGDDSVKLAAFLGDSFVAFEGRVMHRVESGLIEVRSLERECVVVKPPAGDVYFLTPTALNQEYAIVVKTLKTPKGDKYRDADGKLDEAKVVADGGIVGTGHMNVGAVISQMDELAEKDAHDKDDG